MADGPRIVEIQFDLIDHRVEGRSSKGGSVAFPLEPMTVAAFHGRFLSMLEELGATARFSRRPSEIPDAVPFEEDETPRPYDADAAGRFFKALTLIVPVFQRFRTGFIGKVSPVQLFWGSFDLNVTRYSGRLAPLHPGGMPGLPDAVMQEAESHENAAAGFWPGGGMSGIDYPAFYSYAYPAPEGFGSRPVQPAGAFFSSELGEYLLPYDVVRQAPDPEAALLAFLQSTYEAAADPGGWNRQALECALGEPLRPRPLS